MKDLDHPTMGSTFAIVHRDTVDVLLNQDITIPLHKMTILQYRIEGVLVAFSIKTIIPQVMAHRIHF